MRRTILLMAMSVGFLGAASAVSAADRGDRSIEREVRDLRRLATELRNRLERLEVKIAESKAAAPDRAVVEGSEWDVFGMRLAEAEVDVFRGEDVRYRGGMRVVKVRDDGPAARAGIRKGDVLVGVHVWEIVNRKNLEFVLSRDDVGEAGKVKFYVVRGGETLYGELELPGE